MEPNHLLMLQEVRLTVTNWFTCPLPI